MARTPLSLCVKDWFKNRGRNAQASAGSIQCSAPRATSGAWPTAQWPAPKTAGHATAPRVAVAASVRMG